MSARDAITLYGDPALPPRFWDKIEVGESGCWNWLACLDRKGYARYMHDGRNWKAHRLSYLVLRGPIPDSLPLDHLCRVRNCVNPDHLEPVTPHENARRGLSSLSGKNGDTCRAGLHPWPESAVQVSDGRLCGPCKNRPRTCETCGKTTRRGNLSRHVRTHAGAVS